MLDFMSKKTALAKAICLTGPLMDGPTLAAIKTCVGADMPVEFYDNPAAGAQAALHAGQGVHLIAHGTAAYHALRVATRGCRSLRSVTLVAPDLLAALPDFASCCRWQTRMMRAVTDMVAHGRPEAAAARYLAWLENRGPWRLPPAPVAATRAISGVVRQWQAQQAAPVNLLDLVNPPCPIRILVGNGAPSDIRWLAQVLATTIPDVSLAIGLQGTDALTSEVVDFIVASDQGRQVNLGLAAA